MLQREHTQLSTAELLAPTPPTNETKTLSAGRSISFVGNYVLIPTTGTIAVTSTPSGAGFQINGPGLTYISGNTPATFTNLPSGNYEITWNILLGGYVTPPSETKTLLPDTTLPFVVTYPRIFSRVAPFDFFVGCIGSSTFGNGEVPVLNSDPVTGLLDLGIHATVVGNALGETGAGVTYTPDFSGNVLVEATIEVGPSSSQDFLSLFALPDSIGRYGIESLDTDATVTVAYSASQDPFVVGLQTVRSAALTPMSGGTNGTLSQLLTQLTYDSHIYRPAEQFTVQTSTTVVAGQPLRVCAGITSKVVSATPIAILSGMAEARYHVKLISIEVLPQP